MSEEIFLAILEDRHYDIQLEPFKTYLDAVVKCAEWQKSYGDRYEWHEENIDSVEYWAGATLDDGPRMWIEKKILK